MFYQISQICSLRDIKHVPLSFLTADYHSHYTQYCFQHIFLLSFLSPSPFPFGIMLLGLIVFYPFQFNLSLSFVKLNANSIPLTQLFPGLSLFHLATSPDFSQPHTSHISGVHNTFIISSLLLSCIVS